MKFSMSSFCKKLLTPLEFFTGRETETLRVMPKYKIVKLGNKVGFVSTEDFEKRQVFIPATEVAPGGIVVRREVPMYFFIKMDCMTKEYRLIRSFGLGFVVADEEDRKGIFDKNGKVVLPLEYFVVRVGEIFNPENERIKYLIYADGKRGSMDENGEIIWDE